MSKFFEKLKNLPGDVGAQSVSAARNLWQEYGDDITVKALDLAEATAALGKPYIVDDEKFKAHVNDPLWEMLPWPVRLVGRKHLRWDDMLFGLRDSIFLIDGEGIQFHSAAKGKLVSSFKAVLHRTFRAAEFGRKDDESG